MKSFKFSVFSFVLIIFVLLALLSLSYTQDVTEILQKTEQTSAFELVKDWRVLSLLAVMFSVIVVAIVYMVGVGFDMPDLKGLAAVELNQTIVTAIIVAVLLSTITFLDLITAMFVNESDILDPNNPDTILNCGPTDFCAKKISQAYFKDLLDTINNAARGNLISAFNYAEEAASRTGWSCNTFILPIPCLWGSFSYADGAHLILQTERLNIVLETYATILSSIYAQQFFIEKISFTIAPALLLIGIVARTLFFTRKLGGLLMAIGIGVMFVFPTMYVFNWFTMNVMLFGDAVVGVYGAVSCPEECKTAPLAFESSSPITPPKMQFTQYFSVNELSKRLEESGAAQTNDKAATLAYNLSTGKIESVTISGNIKIYSCEWMANHTAFAQYGGYCPQECRIIPYPALPKCLNYTTQFACAALDGSCKYIPYVDLIAHPDNYNTPKKCPKKCRTIPPLSTNCDYIESYKTLKKKEYNCIYSPIECRVALKDNQNWRLEDCLSTDKYKVMMPNGTQVETFTKATLKSCVAVKDDPYSSCAYQIADEETLEKECDGCVFVPVQYTFDPPIYLNCLDGCSQQDTPLISPADVTKQSNKGMVGRDDIKNVASVLLPSFLLPLLNILVTVMFIKTFSPLFGGDIEIPGLQKVL